MDSGSRTCRPWTLNRNRSGPVQWQDSTIIKQTPASLHVFLKAGCWNVKRRSVSAVDVGSTTFHPLPGLGSGKQAFSTTELHMPQDHIRARQQLQDPRVPATQAEEAISSGQSLHHSATHCLEVGCRRSRGFMSGLPVTTSKTTQPKLHKSTALVNAACKATGPDTKFHSSGGR